MAGQLTDRSVKPGSSSGEDLTPSAGAGLATTEPRPGRLSTRPRSCSVAKARVTVVRLTPARRAMSRCRGRVWTLEDVPQQIMEGFQTVSANPIVLLLLANLFLMIVGMFMEDVSGILLAEPLLMPVITEAGVDPIHFSAVVATNLGMGPITLPTAPILYFAALSARYRWRAC